MEISKNKKLGNNKFYNTQFGKQDNKFTFVLPTIMFSQKKLLSWDLKMFSIFLSWGKFYYQINIFESFRNTNTEVFKENMSDLITILRSFGYTIANMPMALDYLNKNSYLTKLLKNANLEHPYIKTVFILNLQNLPFIKQIEPK